MKLYVLNVNKLYFVTPFANTNYVFTVAHIFNGRFFSGSTSHHFLTENNNCKVL